MTAVPAPVTAPQRTGPNWGRLVAGALIASAGIAWLIDGLGVPVPWRALPAAGLIVVGLVIAGLRRVPGELAGLAAVLLVAAMLAALPLQRYAGPIGERTVAPAVTEWPVGTTVGVGTLKVDLTDRALPAGGRMEVAVGVGRLVVTVPAGSVVGVVAAVGAGEIKVDGRAVSNGVNPHWSQPAGWSGAVRVDARVGTGVIEVWHE